MPKNVLTVDEQKLAAVPLPTHSPRYTAVGHMFIVNETLAQLQANNFTLKSKEYKTNLNGEVAQGVYHLEYGNDPDLGLMFAWGNSYDKTMRFRCAIGAYVHVCGNGMIAGDMSNYATKHVGDAKDDVKDHIKAQIQGAASYFNALVADKDYMKTVTVTENQVAELMGLLYFKEDIITSSQLITIKEQYAKPAFNYNAPENSLWAVYNHITYALKKAHPKTWMEQQKSLHALIKEKFFPAAPTVDPNQISIIDQVEKEESAPEAVTEEETTLSLSLDDYNPLGSSNEAPCETAEELLTKAEPNEESESEASKDSSEEQEEKEGSQPEPESNEFSEGDFPAPPADLPTYGQDNSSSEERSEADGVSEEPEQQPESETTEEHVVPVSTEGTDGNEQPESEVLSQAGDVYAEDTRTESTAEVESEKQGISLEETETVQMTEDELNSQLHGVDNNPESVIAETPSLEDQLLEKHGPCVGHEMESAAEIEKEEQIVEAKTAIDERFYEKKETPSETETNVSLEEQVAGEHIAPVTEEEKAVSAKPIVNEEDHKPLTDGKGKLQPNTGFDTEEKSMSSIIDDDDSNEVLESPDFEF